MWGRLRERWRSRAVHPVSLYSVEEVALRDAEWRRDPGAGAPAVTLWMGPGGRADFGPGLGGRFTFEAWASAPAAGRGTARLVARACREGAVAGEAAVEPVPGAGPARCAFAVPAGTPVALTLHVEGAPGSPWVSWGTPRLLLDLPPADQLRIGLAAARAVLAGGGLPELWRRVRALARGAEADGVGAAYRRWLARERRRLARGRWSEPSPPAPGPRPSSRAGVDARPRVTLCILPAPGVTDEALRRCTESAAGQAYPAKEVVRAPRLARGLAVTRGEYVAVLRGDGMLASGALERVARALARAPDTDLLYSDEDRIEDGVRREPFFKPDWSPEYCLERLYVGQLAVYRRALLEGLPGLDDGAGAEADLLLRALERAERIRHLPEVLWHGFPRSPAPARAALAAHLGRMGAVATVRDGRWPGCYRVAWPIGGDPLVSVVIPTRDRAHLLERCLESLDTTGRGLRHEVVLVDNGSTQEAALRVLAETPHRVVRDPGPFSFARLSNLGARHARGEHLLFLNNDTEAMEVGWLEALVEWSQREAIGAVGAKLHYPDGRLQHVGMALGPKQGVAQLFRGAPGDHPGYFGSAMAVRNCSAVTGACLMTRRPVFEAVGGFDETFAADYSDVDYCLRVRDRGWRVVVTPHARLWHHEFATRGRRAEAAADARFRQRWRDVLRHDPYYNPNLSRRHIDCRPAV